MPALKLNAELLFEARERTRASIRDLVADQAKWNEYLAARASSYEEGRDWILANGFAEHTRLQRMEFWGFIKGEHHE